MRVTFSESDAIRAVTRVRECIGPEHPVKWEFQNSGEFILIAVFDWPQGQEMREVAIATKLRPLFDTWFPSRDNDDSWMVVFIDKDGECSGSISKSAPSVDYPYD